LLIAALIVVTHLATTSFTYPALEDLSDKASHISLFPFWHSSWIFVPQVRFDSSKVLALFAYGLLIEVIQYFLPYRVFSMFDLAADGAGIAVYYLSLPALKGVPFLRRRWKTEA
jgi:VanZ family protein